MNENGGWGVICFGGGFYGTYYGRLGVIFSQNVQKWPNNHLKQKILIPPKQNLRRMKDGFLSNLTDQIQSANGSN